MINTTKLHKAIDALIAISREHREVNVDAIAMMGNQNFATEFCTVCVGISRRTGKTEYIKTRATKNDLVIVPNEQLKKCLYNEAKSPVVTARSIVEWSRGKQTPRMIYIDEPKLVFKVESLENIYRTLFNNEAQTFVLIGTF